MDSSSKNKFQVVQQQEREKIPKNPFDFDDRKDKEINIILLSDLHMEHQKMQKLKNWFQTYNEQLIDYVFLLGDFDNLNQDKKKIDMDLCMQSEAEITDLVSFLEFFCAPIYLIPGNHDPYTMLYPEQDFDRSDVTQYIKNIHKDCIKIRNDLQIVGFGGSVPGYQMKGDSFTEKWQGFPFSSDLEFEKQFKEIEKHFSQNIQTILLTHIGPYDSATTIAYVDDSLQPIYSGSKYLSQIAASHEQHNLLIDFHGHTHYSQGKCQINDFPIINPGALKDGRFGFVQLVQNELSQLWVLRETQFYQLNSF